MKNGIILHHLEFKEVFQLSEDLLLLLFVSQFKSDLNLEIKILFKKLFYSLIFNFNILEEFIAGERQVGGHGVACLLAVNLYLQFWQINQNFVLKLETHRLGKKISNLNVVVLGWVALNKLLAENENGAADGLPRFVYILQVNLQGVLLLFKKLGANQYFENLVLK